MADPPGPVGVSGKAIHKNDDREHRRLAARCPPAAAGFVLEVEVARDSARRWRHPAPHRIRTDL